jgi:outer membrane protein OmpA-like peptidoglycan-associated protein
MNKISRSLLILAAVCFIRPTPGQADIVDIKNGDKLFGKIQSTSFAIQTPYGEVFVQNEFLKSITFKNESVGRWVVETVNNDVFSGTLLTDRIAYVLEDGTVRQLAKEEIKRIKREVNGPSHAVTTTIITMNNNDRFSGRFLSSPLEIQADYITRVVQAHEINRIEFGERYPADTKILLENGDLITGMLNLDQIRLAPDAVSELTVAKSSIRSIQFNAPKMVLREFAGQPRSEKDSDGDGIPDYADLCMQTSAGVAVKPNGCAEKSSIAKTESAKKAATRKFEDILFDFDQYELKPQYYSVLNEVAAMLSQNPAAKVEIQGHTDNIGSADYNQKLSERRARAVKNYFIHRGIDGNRLFPIGLGFTANTASNENEAGRALNRRVEFAIQN